MAMILAIPESITEAMRLPEPEIPQRLKTELAASLYSAQILSFGKARELAEMQRLDFARLLTSRGIARHYGEDDLDDDLAYAHHQ